MVYFDKSGLLAVAQIHPGALKILFLAHSLGSGLLLQFTAVADLGNGKGRFHSPACELQRGKCLGGHTHFRSHVILQCSLEVVLFNSDSL